MCQLKEERGVEKEVVYLRDKNLFYNLDILSLSYLPSRVNTCTIDTTRLVTVREKGVGGVVRAYFITI